MNEEIKHPIYAIIDDKVVIDRYVEEHELPSVLAGGLYASREDALKALKGKWLANMDTAMKVKDLSRRTQETYHTQARLYLEEKNTLGLDDCHDYVEDRKVEVEPKTVNVVIQALRWLTMANGTEVKFRAEKVLKSLSAENIPTEEEYERIIAYCDGSCRKVGAMIRLLATTGLRIHEALRVSARDVMAGKMIIRGKGGKRRMVYFSDQLIESVRAAGYCDTDKIFINRYGGCMTDRAFTLRLKTIAAKTGIAPDKMHAHAFRHFFAKQFLVRNPESITTLSELLGHSSLDTTMIYLQKSEDEKRADFNKTVTW